MSEKCRRNDKMQSGHTVTNEHKRIKHRQMPGDLSRAAKIAMREGRVPFDYFPWQRISVACAKSFQRELKRRSAKRQRRRSAESHDGAWAVL